MGQADSLTIADQALLTAVDAWGGADDPRFWSAIGRTRGSLLRNGRDSATPRTSDSALGRLRREHAAATRPDHRRVHPSWWLRALKEETPAVRRTVAAHVPADLLGPALPLSPTDLATDRPPLPEAIRCALVLWTERLVGDIADRPDDPFVILVLTRLNLRDILRLVRSAGLAKWAVAGVNPAGLRTRDRERFAHFRSTFAEPSPMLGQLASHDVKRQRPSGRHAESRLGLLTVARLLGPVEPYRTRWALQHLPYDVAKLVRGLLKSDPAREASWLACEAEILQAAWERLNAEGRIGPDFGAVS